MTKRSLLLVDGDAKSLRVLEVSLRKAGFTVSTADSGQAALQLLQSMRPDLVISDTDMPDMDGYEFCRQFKATEKWKDVPFIFLTGKTDIAHKIRGLELGVDDYLTKPIYIKEILTRVRILLQKHDRTRFEQKKENNTRFAGQLSDMGVVDLIQTIEVSRKTGVIHFRADEKRQATMFFKEGKVIDAEAGHLQGEDAVYRLLTWSDGEFEALFRPVRRRAVISMSSQSLLMEGMRRLDEWGRLQEQLPPLTERFQVVYDELWDRLAELPDDINQILRLFDTRRTLQEVIDGANIGDLEAVEVISKLYFEGIIVEVEQERGLKSGSYPVDDLVLQARAASEAAASSAASSSAADGQRLAALEEELHEATEQDATAQDATASLPFKKQPKEAKSSKAEDALSGLLQDAISAATPVTQAQGKASITTEPKRSTAKGLAVAPLPPVGGVDSEDTVPATKAPGSTVTRQKTLPIGKLTPKQELDSAARLADQQAGSITSPVEDADIRALLADQEASSITKPMEDAIARARSADDEATRLAQEEQGAKTGQVHTLATGTPADAAAAAEADSPSENPGQEYEADLDDLGEVDGLDDTAIEGTSTSGAPLAATSEVSAAAASSSGSGSKTAAASSSSGSGSKTAASSSSGSGSKTAASSSSGSGSKTAAASSSGSGSATKNSPSKTSGAVVTPLPRKRPALIGATTAEIDRNEVLADEPNSPPLLWYVLGAVAAGFLGFVAIKAIGGGDSGDGAKLSQNSDGTSGKTTALAQSSPDARVVAALVGDAGGPLAAPTDAGRVATTTPIDAGRVVTAPPPDAARIVAIAAPDARTATATPNAAPTEAEAIKDLQKQARRAKRQGDRAGALIFLDEALALKRTGSTLFLKAEVLLSLGDSAAAQKVAKELTQLAPRRSKGWRIYGLASYEVEDYAGARKGFGTYLELAPNAKDKADVITILESM